MEYFLSLMTLLVFPFTFLSAEVSKIINFNFLGVLKNYVFINRTMKTKGFYRVPAHRGTSKTWLLEVSLYLTSAIFVLLISGEAIAGPNSAIGISILPGFFLIPGIHAEYGSTVVSDPDKDREDTLAAGISGRFTARLFPGSFGASVLSDVSYEVFNECFRGKYGLELLFENGLFVSYPRTKFAITVRSGGIKRFAGRSETGIFYGAGILIPMPEYLRNSSDVLYAFSIEGNSYFNDGIIEITDMAASLCVMYKFRV